MNCRPTNQELCVPPLSRATDSIQCESLTTPVKEPMACSGAVSNTIATSLSRWHYNCLNLKSASQPLSAIHAFAFPPLVLRCEHLSGEQPQTRAPCMLHDICHSVRSIFICRFYRISSWRTFVRLVRIHPSTTTCCHGPSSISGYTWTTDLMRLGNLSSRDQGIRRPAGTTEPNHCLSEIVYV